MRAVIQRCKSASVTADGLFRGSIETGLVVLVGVEEQDEPEDADWLAAKICALRIFSDDEGKMNRDLKEANGNLLIVSQFTLHAKTKKGNRPSFIRAASPEKAEKLYLHFVDSISAISGTHPVCGVFGAHMEVELINDGPVTILIDTRNKE